MRTSGICALCTLVLLVSACSSNRLPERKSQNSLLTNRTQIDQVASPVPLDCPGPTPARPSRTSSIATPASPERHRACGRHVTEGLQGVALQIIALSKQGSQKQKRAAQSCVFGQPDAVVECLTVEQQHTLAGYAEQRQRDCVGWPPELAACILKQPGAVDCNPDEYPFWLKPIDRGRPGPGIAWRTTLRKFDHQDTWLDIDNRGIVLVQDAEGLRGLCAGAELWRRPPRWIEHIAVAKSIIRVNPDQKTGGFGTVSGDAENVYVVSFGADGSGPVQVLAIDRSSGETTWQTELVGASTEPDEYSEVQVQTRGRTLAVHVDSELFVLGLEPGAKTSPAVRSTR